MNYRTSEVAKLSGVSSRTLRYYDEIGLLKPNSVNENGYRIYTTKEIDLLQLILFYREMDIPLEEIRTLISSKDFDRTAALENHLLALIEKKCALEKIIMNVTQSLRLQREGICMSNTEKFNGLEAVAENETRYGDELRNLYGNESIKESFDKVKKGNYDDILELTAQVNKSLITAFHTKEVSSNEAFIACENHKKLLEFTWADGMYTKENHLKLVKSFTEDDRFTSYYEKLQKGLMEFFYNAIQVYCK